MIKIQACKNLNLPKTYLKQTISCVKTCLFVSAIVTVCQHNSQKMDCLFNVHWGGGLA